jgi:3-oxoacyl-[acyl-carrier-protein] synthase I
MVYFLADNIISSLGFTTIENFDCLLSGKIGIRTVHDQKLYPEPIPVSKIDTNQLEEKFDAIDNPVKYTKLEKMLILSIVDTLSQTNIDTSSKKTLFIISTTKGNIDLLEKEGKELFEKERVLLWRLGQVIADYFQNPNQAVVLSNACVSGVLALNVAASWIGSGQFDHAVVCGGDIISGFVASGFMSFMSLSPNPCKPFDKKRNGLSLGEGAGTIIMSKHASGSQKIVYKGGGSANDANHISGPSRTGEGSFVAINRAMKEAGIHASEVDYISAHGTATDYNDEMESIAISRCNLTQVPVNSFKGNWGHTLGAAGLIETAAMLEQMRKNTLISSAGFTELGVSKPINVVTKNTRADLNTCLKLASGFGGSNAALIAIKEI